MRFDFSKLKTPIEIYKIEIIPNDGLPTPPSEKKVKFHECFAHVESVSLKDYQTAISNNTQNQIKIFIRDYEGITNKMQIKYNGIYHKIESIMPSYGNSHFSVIVAEAIQS